MKSNPFEYASVEAASFFTEASDPLRPDQLHGRVRVATFDNNTQSIEIGGQLCANKIPAGARILRGYLRHGAGGVSSAIDIGLYAVDDSGFLDKAETVADAPALLGDNIDTAAAGEKTFADTIARNSGYRTEKEAYLVVTAVAAAFAAVALQGYVEYVVD